MIALCCLLAGRFTILRNFRSVTRLLGKGSPNRSSFYMIEVSSVKSLTNWFTLTRETPNLTGEVAFVLGLAGVDHPGTKDIEGEENKKQLIVG